MEHLGRKIFHAENPGIQKLRGEYHLAFGGGFCVEMKLNLEIRWRNVAGIDMEKARAQAQAQYDGLIGKYPERSWGKPPVSEIFPPSYPIEVDVNE